MRKGEHVYDLENRTIARLEELFVPYPDGLSVTEVIELARHENVLSKPNAVIKYLQKMEGIGILKVSRVKAGRGPGKKIYRLVDPVLSSRGNSEDALKTIEMKKKILRLISEKEITKLGDSPGDYWILYVLDIAKKAGLTEGLVSNAEKGEFFERLVDKTSPFYLAFSRALLLATDLSFSLIKAVLGSILLSIYEGKTDEEIKLMAKKRFELTSTRWGELMTKTFTSSVAQSSERPEGKG